MRARLSRPAQMLAPCLSPPLIDHTSLLPPRVITPARADILDAPVVYLAKHNDLFTLNDAIEVRHARRRARAHLCISARRVQRLPFTCASLLMRAQYVRDNELSTHIVIVHFVDDLSDVIKIVEKKIGEETERARIAAVAEAAAAAARRAAAAASSGSKEVTALSESKKAKAAEAAGAGAAGGIGKPSAATHSLSVVGMVGTAVNSAASAAVAAVSSAAASAAVVSSAKTPAPPQHSPTLRALPAASAATPQTHGDGKNGGGRGASGVSALAAAAASAASASKAAAAASRMATSPAAAMAAADAAQQAALAAAGAAEAAVAAAQAAELALEAQERGLPTAGAILAQLPPLTLEAQLLQNNIALLDAVHTDMRIDSLIVRGTCFSPEALAWLVEYLRVLPGMVLISSPDVAFPFQVSALGGVRVINRSAMREDRDLSLSRLKRIIHKTAADLRMHTVEDDDDDDDGDFDGDGGPSSASFAATLPNTPQRVVRRRAVA